MFQKSKELKDFLYLDFERVRSFYAQMFEGETQSRVTNRGKNLGIRGQIKTSLAGIFGVNFEPSISENSGVSETKSLHHQLYIEFENGLGKFNKLAEVNSYSDLDKKPFIRIKGRIQIVDYTSLLNRIDKTFELLDTFSKIEQAKLESSITDRNKLALAKKKISDNYSKPKDYKNTFDAIESIYGQSLILNVFLENTLFAKATLVPDLFQFTSSGIISGTESLIDEEWIIVGQIINKISTPQVNTSDGSKLDAIFANQLLPIYRDIKSKIESESKFEIIPISIYRSL